MERVLVREGEAVTAGQELARLDSATAASLAQSAAQAQVDVIAAQEALDELLDPTALSLAQSGRDVASAELDLQTAEKALDDLLSTDKPGKEKSGSQGGGGAGGQTPEKRGGERVAKSPQGESQFIDLVDIVAEERGPTRS